jgi:hypothetical protein
MFFKNVILTNVTMTDVPEDEHGHFSNFIILGNIFESRIQEF